MRPHGVVGTSVFPRSTGSFLKRCDAAAEVIAKDHRPREAQAPQAPKAIPHRVVFLAQLRSRQPCGRPFRRASGNSKSRMVRQRGVEPVLIPVLPFLAEIALDVLTRCAWPGLEVASPHHRALQKLRNEEGLEQPHRRSHPNEHLTQMHEDGQRHHGIGCEMQGMNFVEIQNLMEESGERRNQARHGEGQEVHGSLRISWPWPRLSRPHDGTVRHDLAGKAKVPVCCDAGGREHCVAGVLGHGNRRRAWSVRQYEVARMLGFEKRKDEWAVGERKGAESLPPPPFILASSALASSFRAPILAPTILAPAFVSSHPAPTHHVARCIRSRL
uniref:Uncharacterized protein n=2 Tax=Oryza sativa subsp. japonica TaxID=39947 RepID=Q10B59_ORYSJ|nr:hypothetical protein [Oryza sativa Japonica Group]ABF99686.1 retrotransposon protein, putative, unclassified [Oryza sativa Japonica Group]